MQAGDECVGWIGLLELLELEGGDGIFCVGHA